MRVSYRIWRAGPNGLRFGFSSFMWLSSLSITLITVKKKQSTNSKIKDKRVHVPLQVFHTLWVEKNLRLQAKSIFNILISQIAVG